MRTLLRSIAAFALILVALPAGAQVGAVRGTLRDAGTQAPLAGAHVRATGTGFGEALSGNNGSFMITNLPPGEYTLVVTMVGYHEQRLEGVRVVAGQSTTADMALSVSAFELNPLVVSASRRQEKALEAPATVEVIPRVQIQERPAITPVEHLKALPGVDIITNGLQSTNVVARGFNNIFSGSLHTLTDYRIASIPSLRVNLLHFIPANNEDIERMEVVLGPGSALYGPNTANGVLHIITASPLLRQGTTVSIATGTRSGQPEDLQRTCVTANVIRQWCADQWPGNAVDRGALIGSFRTAHLVGENLGVKLSGQYFRGTEWIFIDDVEVTARQAAISAGADPNTLDTGIRDFGLERWSFEGRADWRILGDATASFTSGYTNIENAVELTGLGAGQARGWSNSFYQARFNKDRLFAQVYLNASDAGDTYLIRSGDPIIDNSKMVVGQVQHGTTLGDGRYDFTYGLDALRTMPATGGTIHGANEDDDHVSEFGVYLQSEIGLSDRFELVFAGRSDWHSHVDHPVFSPRAALVFSPVRDQSIRLTYNRAFSTPSTLNLFLDLDGGPAGALGPLGYRARAQGTGENGYSFMDDDGTIRGIRSPFANGGFNGSLNNPDNHFYADPTTDDYWKLGIGMLHSRAGVTAAEAEALAGITGGALGVGLLDTNTLTVQPISAGIRDVAKIEESNTETFEIGYKGILGERVLLAADAWYERRTNFVSPLTVVTPLIMLDSTTVAERIKGAGVMSDARAEQIANGMSSLPIAVTSSPDINAEGADLLATYVNFGNIDLTGADINATYLLTDRWQLGLGASWVSDDYFIEEGRLIALNAPDMKGTGRVAYRNMDLGLNGELRARYTSEFPVNSAPFAATQCIAEIQGNEALPTGSIDEPCMEPFTIMDLTLGYALPWVDGASVQMVMNNVLGTEYRSFVGVPSVGRFTMVQLRYEF